MKLPAYLLPPCSAALCSLLLAGCAGQPAPPAWQSSAHSSLQGYSSAYLSGDTRIADYEFARARRALASTGRADLVAQAELIRCATRVASLEFDRCASFEAIAADASAAERSYAAYIAGRWDGLDPALLPAQHRALLADSAAGAAGTVGDRSRLAALDDPLARLVAAGAMLQNGRLTPADIEVATETASGQGWRRPLLAWLGVQAQRARQAGAQDALARIERRIRLVSETPK